MANSPQLLPIQLITARQHGDKGISRTFVLSEQDNAVIMGFFTLTLCEIKAEKLPRQSKIIE